MSLKTFARALCAICLMLICFTPSFAQQTGSIAGVVVDKATQAPLIKVSVKLVGANSGTVTDSLGRFRLGGIPVKTYNIEFSLVGFSNQSLYNIVVTSGNEQTYRVELEAAAKELNTVTVTANRRTARAATLETPLSVQRLTTEEIKASPGGNFDVSKVIQTLPGVGGGQAGGGFRNDIIIRGGAPNENVFYLDGIEIPVINHFQTQGSSGGPQGLLNISFIEDVKLSTSAFDARYDNAISSVFQFKQRTGNPNQLQGNFRLSATDAAATLEGPLSKSKKTTFLVSARRSYLQLLFSVLDLSIRPNYWDFQTKITHNIDSKTVLSIIGLGAIDEFRFAPIKTATPDKLYQTNANPIISQWNYTGGVSLRRLIHSGFINASLSRNAFNNENERYEDNEHPSLANQTLDYRSRETENKFRFDVNQTVQGWKVSYGVSAQLAEYQNKTFSVIRKQLTDSNGNIIQPAVLLNFNSPLKSLWRLGAFLQIGKRLFDNRVGVSAGIRTDMNSLTNEGWNAARTLSPRVSVSYALAEKWSVSASVGRYYKLAPYTILGFADNNGNLVNKSARYLRSDHYTAGVEFLPDDKLRITVEGFIKRYANVPVSLRDGIALSNLGSDFTVLGNEAVVTNGKGRASGIEFFVQKKLTKRFFGILSYTYYRSEYAGRDNVYKSSSWDNRHLLSVTWGYKFQKNWELGLKFRYQGGAPYTPYDLIASQLNYLSRGQGVLDYNRLNSLRLTAFNSSDVRIDKRWNLKKASIDLFLDVTNWYGAKSFQSPSFTFKRNDTNTAFVTTDGKPVVSNGSNAIPFFLKNEDVTTTPSIGVIVEF